MNDNVRQLRGISDTLSPGGEPPDNGEMDARVKRLEDAIAELPTKANFAELRADIAKGQTDMHKAIADNHRWTHTALVGFAGLAVVGILGVMGTIWSIGKPTTPVTAPAAVSPVTINMPGSQAVPAAPASKP
ncbi:hypothetical protein [Acidovorax sp. A1169]|uniref:hypothetical protein n=1 Tax=Acidovorax sp. A1169 TaxID=3059524 RepID=UPI002737EA37|nr:hypothetical protein [Acidovorax sp. A1169]MDP4076245.1 hypothetical protein [Acidovorax sp. A1169]